MFLSIGLPRKTTDSERQQGSHGVRDSFLLSGHSISNSTLRSPMKLPNNKIGDFAWQSRAVMWNRRAYCNQHGAWLHVMQHSSSYILKRRTRNRVLATPKMRKRSLRSVKSVIKSRQMKYVVLSCDLRYVTQRFTSFRNAEMFDQRFFINHLGNRVVVLGNDWKNLEVNNILQTIFIKLT